MMRFLFSFKGRMSRLTYWASFLYRIPVYVAWVVLGEVIDYHSEVSDGFILLVTPILLAVLYAEIAITAKRLHDTNRSGWAQLWALLPIVGGLYLIVILLFLRDPKPNEYGDPPESVVIPFIKDLPKRLWRFLLNRVRELGKALRDED